MSYREKIKSLIGADYAKFNTVNFKIIVPQYLKEACMAYVLALMEGYKNQGIKFRKIKFAEDLK